MKHILALLILAGCYDDVSLAGPPVDPPADGGASALQVDASPPTIEPATCDGLPAGTYNLQWARKAGTTCPAMPPAVVTLPGEVGFATGAPAQGCALVHSERSGDGCTFKTVATCPSAREPLDDLDCMTSRQNCGPPAMAITTSVLWISGWQVAAGLMSVKVTGHASDAANCGGVYDVLLTKL